MKRYIFFDKKTGQILHTHSVYKFGSDDFQEVDKEELKRMVGRIVDLDKVGRVIADIPQQSSAKVEIKIDTDSLEPIVSKLPRNHWVKKAEAKTKEGS